MCVKNGLQLTETDKELSEQDLKLTELEGALIAKNILFQKIFQLPKSRWTALKDRIINVPIYSEAIMNTLQQMPRTPTDAGLVGVALKRKQEYKNTHQHQLINPDKLFKMLRKLKTNGNPYYQFYDDYNVYHERCKSEDPVGYDVVLKKEEVKEDKDDIPEKILLENTDCEGEENEEENTLKTKDPVKKYQFFMYD